MTLQLDRAQSEALTRAVQVCVPLVPEPWAVLGERMGLDGQAVLAELCRQRDGGQLREISAVLEGSLLGFDSALVAGAIEAERLEEVAAVVGRHPLVSHCYERTHALNLWFTIAAPSDIGVAPVLEALARLSGVDRFHSLPRTHTFKIGVAFDPETRANASLPGAGGSANARVASEQDQRLFCALQQPLELTDRPFEVLAERAGVDCDELLAFGRAELGGTIRRYAATYRHRRLGVRGNGMIAWRFSPERLVGAGQRLARVPEVSHCYARASIPQFPYSLYSMVHASDEAAVSAIAETLAAELGPDDHAVLFSRHEFKKTRLRYFVPEAGAWWRDHQGPSAAPRGE